MEFVKTDEDILNHETFKKVSALCDQYGYTLHTLINDVYDGFTYPRFQVFPKRENRYSPDIYYTGKTLPTKDDCKYVYEIQTTSYGALEMSEYETFMKQTSDAYELVKALSEIPVESWPQHDKREK